MGIKGFAPALACWGIFLLTVIFASSTWAETYSPFNFHDRALHERPDIKPHIKKQKYDIPLAHQSAMVSVDSTDAKVNFVKEVHEIISSVWTSNDLTEVPSHNVVRDLVQCSNNENWERSLRPPMPNSPQCARLSQLIEASLPARACTFAARPELFVTDHPSGRVDGDDMYNLEKAIATAGEALLRLEFPKTTALENLFQRLRVTLLKIRKDHLRIEIANKLAVLSELKTTAESNKDCFSSPGEANELSIQVQAMTKELLDADLELLRIYELGVLQAASDRAEVLRSGKKRDELPFRALTDLERQELTMVLGAVYWRVRGGGLIAHKGGSQTARKWFVENLTSTLVKLNCGSNCPKDAFRIGGQMRSKLMMKGWGQWFDMGNTQNGNESEDNRDRYYDLTRMTWRGEYQVDSSVGSLKRAKFDANPFLLAGLSMGSCYWYGWNHLKNIYIGETAELPYRHFLHGPTSWGEVCIGGSMYLGLSRSLLAGYR